jgi:hypothetical protein
MVMLANQPPRLVCIRPNLSLLFRVSGLETRNWKQLFRIAIPAPLREAQDELNTLNYSCWFQVSGLKPPACRL